MQKPRNLVSPTLLDQSKSPISSYAKYMLMNSSINREVSYKKSDINKVLSYGDNNQRISPTFLSKLPFAENHSPSEKALYNPTFEVFKKLNGLK